MSSTANFVFSHMVAPEPKINKVTKTFCELSFNDRFNAISCIGDFSKLQQLNKLLLKGISFRTQTFHRNMRTFKDISIGGFTKLMFTFRSRVTAGLST